MIELCAVEFKHAGMSAIEPLLTPRAPLQAGPTQRRECRRGHVYMVVSADRVVDTLFFNSDELSLICRADLLSIDPYSNISTASELAKLYLNHGDTFVTGLRGTFAVILYDHRSNTLKAWTDHFGAEKLVFTNSSRLLAVSTDLRPLLGFLPGPPSIDAPAISQYLQYGCIPTPKT